MTLEHVIPLRFVETLSSPNSGPLHPADHIQQAVARANNIWATAAVAFWIKSVERHPMPHLHKWIRDKIKFDGNPGDPEGCPNGTYCFTWSEVRDELRQVFPNMPVNAYPGDDDKSAAYWLQAASAFYGNPNEILVWLLDEPGGGAGTAAPWTGRLVYLRRGALWSTTLGIPSTQLAHEIGHFLGLVHNDVTWRPPGYDHCDRWDRVFIPGNPNIFFSSKDDPSCDPSSVQYIAKAKEAIYADSPFGPVHVVLNGQEYIAGGDGVDDALKGLFRATGLAHSPPDSWGFAMNVMGHIGIGSEIDGHVPRFLSESQVAVINDFLSRDVDFNQGPKDLWLTDGGVVPIGAIPGGLTSLRTRLGQSRVQEWSHWEHLGGAFVSAPSVASWAPDRLDVFVQGTNNHLMHRWWNGDLWSGWEDLGGELSEAPAAVSWGPDRIDGFVRGTDHQLWHKWWNGNQWSHWEHLGGVFASAPTVASWAPDRLDVFVQGTNNHLMHKWWDGNQWRGWEDLGGELSEAPAAVSWGPNRIDCFTRGTDHQLWHKWWDGNQWSQWERLGGAFASAPTVASWAPDRLDVFVQGTNDHLMHRWWDGHGWRGWEDLGGGLTEAPAAVSWGPNRIDCFTRGLDHQLWHRWTWLTKLGPPEVQKWSHWEHLGGVFASAPTVASWAPDRLDVFVRGTNDHLMHKWWDGSQWSGWEDLDGGLSEAPAAVSWGPNRIDCFTPGTDNELWHVWWDGTQWSHWEHLGGAFVSAPTVASWAPNRLDAFVRGTNNHLMHKWWDGHQWSHWEDLGGELTESPAAVSWGPNRIDCFTRGADSQLWHRWWDGTQWSHWEHLGGAFASAPTVASWEPGRLDVFVQGTNDHLMHKWWDGNRWSGWEDLAGGLTAAPAAVSWGPNRIDCFTRGTDNELWHSWTWSARSQSP